MHRLDAQMDFLMEADRLKSVDRANVLLDGSRPENAAEHAWHLCLWAMVLAPLAPSDVDIDAVIAMLLVHDLVEIDAGDTPIDQPDPNQAARETRAADHLFALLPVDQATEFRALWQTFEAAQTPDARWAKALDHIAPVFQVLLAPSPPADHVTIARDNLHTGRAARLVTEWPQIYRAALDMLEGQPITDADLAARLQLLAEADALKSVMRATRLADNSRLENTGEHSWHIALFALVLGELDTSDTAIVVRMLILHDLVEIDAGDVPIFAAPSATVEADEARAADRIFGLLPADTGPAFRALWDTFEANQSPEARFAKSLDRFQPPNLNLANGGGSWIDYAVSEDTVRTRVGTRIAAGAPHLWDWLSHRIAAHFEKL